MIDLQAIVAFNSAAILLMAIVLINSHTSFHLNPLDNKLFRLMVVFTMLQASIQTLSYFIHGVSFPGAYWCNVIISVMLFVNNALFTFLWVLYVDIKLFGDVQRLKRRYSIIGIPAMLVIAGSIVNLFRPVFFHVNRETFEYMRSDLYFIPVISSMFYLLYCFVLTIKYKSQNNEYLFFPALTFLIPIMLANIAEALCYGLNVVWIGAAISMTSIYINLQNQVSYIDALSGLLTRQCMTACLESEIRKPRSSKKIVGIMLDINKFKTINDSFGHLVGDDAIRSTGKIIHDATSSKVKAFRFGGDEFVLIQIANSEQDALATIERIRASALAFN